MFDTDLIVIRKEYKLSGNLKAGLLSVACLILLTSQVLSQEIEILIKGGHVIDPKNSIDALMDVAVAGGKILRVAKDIPSTGAKKVIDATIPRMMNIHFWE